MSSSPEVRGAGAPTESPAESPETRSAGSGSVESLAIESPDWGLRSPSLHAAKSGGSKLAGVTALNLGSSVGSYDMAAAAAAAKKLAARGAAPGSESVSPVWGNRPPGGAIPALALDGTDEGGLEPLDTTSPSHAAAYEPTAEGAPHLTPALHPHIRTRTRTHTRAPRTHKNLRCDWSRGVFPGMGDVCSAG